MAETLISYKINSASTCSLGVTGASLTLNNRAPSTLSLTIAKAPGAASNSAPFSYRDTITVQQGSETIFSGKVDSVKVANNAPGIGWQIIAYDGLFDLEQVPLMNSFSSYNPATGFLEAVDIPRVMLGQSDTGTLQSTGQVVGDIIDRATAAGAHLTKGTILDGRQVPPTQVLDATCGQALSQIIRYHPDAAIWVDGSATINIVQEENLSVVGIDPATDIVPRDSHWTRNDRAPKGVRIYYEITHKVDDSDLLERRLDSAGATSGWPPPLAMTIELAGVESGSKEHTARTRTIPTSETLAEDASKAFVKGLFAQFNAIDSDDLTLDSVEVVPINPYEDQLEDDDSITANAKDWTAPDPEDHPRMLLAPLPPWVDRSMHPARITVQATYSGDDSTVTALSEDGSYTLNAIITLTNAEPKTYKGDGELIIGETPMTGLASDYWNAIKTARIEGTLSGPAIVGGALLTARPGKRVSLPGESPSIVQTTSIDLIAREITVTLGLGEHLTPQDTIELQRAINANKPTYPTTESRTQAADNSQVFRTPQASTTDSTIINSATATARLWNIVNTTVAESLTTTIKIGRPGTIREDTNLDSALTISGITDSHTVSAGKLLVITHSYNSDGEHTGSTLEAVDEWSDYPSPYTITTGAGGFPQMTAYHQALARIYASDTVPAGRSRVVALSNGLSAVELAENSDFQLVQSVIENDSGDMVVVVYAETSTGDITAPE